ncbi:TetR family transcriptional regulator [Cryobacterium sp. TMT1-3]|uniref:TetR family transcriptional regulator n=1 Tax=Cryobacterium luteum TaxID=1424661 RepID=A0A5F0DCB0_9MICO|nr:MULTISPECIES: TetR/AcrR family transcriptional regulator [Cryobacterium]TFB94245.1 TetR family transcriptional regulator [Cryobacterium luteum]TFC24767.1 TetR family transcriptional regulator [Cryobacterium sp. TMT1-3]
MSDPSAPADSALPPAARQADARGRVAVADIAVGLFQAQGYEATSTAQIAAAAGVSRSTFFRQFRSKDDVIFADHDELLEQIGDYFAAEHEDPWLAVCTAAALVFDRFRERLEIVRVRDLLVRQTSVLRDRETVMVSRYEKTFSAFLRRALPGVDPVIAIQFAAAVTATHNFELRRLIRAVDAERMPDSAGLAAELRTIRDRFAPVGARRSGAETPANELIVAVFPASALPHDVAQAIENRLRSVTR